MKKMCTALVIALLVFFVMPARAQTVVPETIRVGLKYGSTAPASVKLSSDSNLEFGYYQGSTFFSLFAYQGKSSIYIRKDSFFTNKNGLFIEVQPGEISSSSDISFGPYHLQVSSAFPDRQQADALLASVQGAGVEGFIAYDDGWRVWVGRYASISEMESENSKLRSRLGEAYQVYPVYPTGGRLQINDEAGRILFMFEGKDRFLVARTVEQGQSYSLINVDGKRFRGTVEFKRHEGGNITVVNTLSLQQYLYGVVPREMSADWHIEALKAQAVAARNYAIVNMNKHASYGFNVCSTTDCQVYGGYDSEKPSSNAAVDDTKGQLIYYNGNPITAFFHASSGGYTENAENVWSVSLPYIKAVEDSFSEGSPHNSWQRVYTADEINSILAAQQINLGSIQNISIDSYTPTGRSLSMTITGSRGSTVLEKEKSRAIFGYDELKSTMFTVETDADLFVIGSVGQPVQKIKGATARVVTAGGQKLLSEGPDMLRIYNGSQYATASKYPTRFIFNGKGWGHGLGMSQWGAKGMAEAGYSYVEILQYYYQGTVVQ
ncbi:MAG: Stage II sporulation protein D (SpoIID) [Firmicutes bacterium]|nr:Stage II sporulation protein D (SpoIID) [Bacillota bacterium]MDI6706633.1 SpoIID/LytB domain-containing protein [Bacillota bacterium]